MADWIIAFIEHHGYAGIALLMLAENVFPPIPSELIMPFAGYAASRGSLSAWGVALAGAGGSVLGALAWYGVGRTLGERRLAEWLRRHGRWLTVSPEDLVRTQAWFDRHGHLAVFFGRMVPAVRTLISVPAGIARMPPGRFLAWSTAGSLVWSGALASAGFALGSQYERIAGMVNVLSTAVLVLLVMGYCWRVARQRR